MEKIFTDSVNDQVSVKNYSLYDLNSLRVSGYVEDYEPGDVMLTIETRKPFHPALSVIAERAKFHVYRLEREAFSA